MADTKGNPEDAPGPVSSQPQQYGMTPQPPPAQYGQPPPQYGQQPYGMQGQQMQYGFQNQMGQPGQQVQMAPIPGAPQGQVAIVAPMAPIPGCPPGLEYLTQLDQLLVAQLIELVELFTGWEMNNKYRINNSMGQQIYFVKEETECCERQFMGPMRGFTMHVTDNLGAEVMRIVRPCKCLAGCCWCATRDCDTCALELQVEAPPGEVVGYVRQGNYCWTSEYIIMDANKKDVLTAKGPCCPVQTICCTSDLDWVISSLDQQHEIGKVSKQWAGVFREMVSDADKFGIHFPVDLDVRMKATLVGLMFMIDFMFFEHKKNN
ncbi:phospholipid scramblase 2-like isoform X2 [Lineus longissimus]|uniref:phospholipid scramblase 2-like isoform X1 n=1 Tax=Lineus longissimus TaxID=88925 RepID=UPI002B4C8B59